MRTRRIGAISHNASVLATMRFLVEEPGCDRPDDEDDECDDRSGPEWFVFHHIE